MTSSLIKNSDIQRQLQFAQARPKDFTGGFAFYAFYVVDLESSAILNQFAFDVPPKSIKLGEMAAAEAVALQEGGYYSDERGRYFPTLNISGSFGLRPTPKRDGTSQPTPSANQRNPVQSRIGSLGVPVPPNGEVTGFDRIVALTNLCRMYWERKESRDTAQVAMIWANWKYGEVWICQPLNLERSRSSPNDKFKATYTLSLRLLEPLLANNQAIDYLTNLNTSKGAQESGQDLKSLLSQAEEQIAILQRSVSLAVDIGESQITQVQQTFSVVIEQCKQGLLQNKALLKSVNNAPLSVIFSEMKEAASNALGLSQTFDSMTSAVSSPLRDLARAYRKTARLLTRMASRMMFFFSQDTANSKAERIGSSYRERTSTGELDLSQGTTLRGDRGTNTSLGTRRIPKGSRTVEVPANTSLKEIALYYLGSAGRWKEIAILNNLQAPYISNTGDGVSVLRAGHPLKLPVDAGSRQDGNNQVFSLYEENRDSDAFRYGRDLRVNENTRDLEIDAKGDLAVIEGLENLAQAQKLKVWHKKGDLKLHPNYGMNLRLGSVPTLERLATYYLEAQLTFLSDSRVSEITQISFMLKGDIGRMKVNLIPKNSDNALSLTLGKS